MRRPFLVPAASLAAGILIGRGVWPYAPTVIFFFILFLLPFLWFFRGRRLFLPLFCLALTATGILRIREAARFPADSIIHFAKNSHWISLEGSVDSLPLVKIKGKREVHSFVLRSDNLLDHGELHETRGKVQVFLFNPGKTISYGSKIRIRGPLSLPKQPVNPGEFDYRRYLAEQGIYAVMEGYGTKSLKILERRGVWPYAPTNFLSVPLVLIQNLRDLCSRRLDRIFPAPANAFLKALILGIRKDLPEDFRDDFIKTGTAHLVAISGMNITLVAGSLFLFSIFLGLPQKGAAIIGLVATAAYVFLSGLGVPVVRAGWMAGLFFSGLLMEREKDLAHSLFFAFFMILAFDPMALFQVGFQLSFLCVFSLIAFSFLRQKGEWVQTAVVLIGTFPVGVAYFNVFSWVSIFANLLAIPLFNLGVLSGMAGLLTPLPFIEPLFVKLADLFLNAGLWWIRFWAGKSWGYFYLSPPSWKLILFYYVALALALILQKIQNPKFLPARPFVLAVWLLSAAMFFIPAKEKKFALTVFSMGQNELIHVEFPQRSHWLINTGRALPSNQARWTISPYLRELGVKRLAGILLTDFSGRHSGGLVTLGSNFSIGSFVFPKTVMPKQVSLYLNSRRRAKTPKLPVSAGERISVTPSAGFEILDVTKDQLALLIYYEDQKFLMLPNWDRDGIEKILPKLTAIQHVNALILPAKGEPDPELWHEILAALLPEWVILPKRNQALEPIIQSLKQEEIPILVLAETGALRFEADDRHLALFPFINQAGIDTA